MTTINKVKNTHNIRTNTQITSNFRYFDTFFKEIISLLYYRFKRDRRKLSFLISSIFFFAQNSHPPKK